MSTTLATSYASGGKVASCRTYSKQIISINSFFANQINIGNRASWLLLPTHPIRPVDGHAIAAGGQEVADQRLDIAGLGRNAFAL